MKWFFSSLMLFILVLCASFVFAETKSNAKFSGVQAFTLYSSASGTAVKSDAVYVGGFKKKTVFVQGYNMSTQAAASLSGTALVECGPTATGPWSTCTNSATATTVAVSTTANGMMSWDDAAQYIRASWAKTAGRVGIWLRWLE